MQQSPDPKYVLDLAAKLVDAKAHVALLQAQWDDLFGSSHVMDSTPTPTVDASDEDGITARFIQLLHDNRDKSFSVQAIALAIGAAPIQVHRAIGRLLPKGKIKRAGRGAYTSPESEIADDAAA
jgi:hypothetical protein